ncbi:ATP-binding cassette domain-containing protein [Ferrovum sp. PN-J185]|uniref:ATP-binding cassette domain-containing protein n=1 Tax=Ferrovum sp. PN-J185 TaxID=1356306 RepID=UPI00079598F5|nr:ATP-binding cassette domain-containing protein [Ferrovum sp. PN-J185]KXW56462.1 putative ABC transporter ATP-binding protein YbhF [Ferrovum sp. PN-J185]MCC6068189.1 ATP-binding cassette domain-containing protein [Ferrovum sp. PN-J185]
MSEITLSFNQVTKTFSKGKERLTAIKQLSFSLKKGKVTGLLGPDGAGKSTLMRLAAQLLLPDQGTIQLSNQSSHVDTHLLPNSIGYMPQRFGLYEDLTVQENLNLYSDLHNLSDSDRTNRQHELLKLTALGPFGARRAGALSGGMKQKLGLACALLRAPQILLLDEPTVGVDPIARRELWTIIQNLKKQNVTVLMSTAYFDEAEKCDDILLLHEGCLLEHNTPQQLIQRLHNRTFIVTHQTITKRQLHESLRTREGIQDVRINTEGIRVLISAEHIPIKKEKECWQSITPSFEDAFIDILGQNNTQHKFIDSNIFSQEHAVIKNNNNAVITVNKLNKIFGEFQAVKNVSFNVNKGEIFGLLGANGAGKTTTFRMLCGLLPSSSGELLLDNIDMRHFSSEGRGRIGYVAQKFSLYGNLSCTQNLNFFAHAYGLKGNKKKERINWVVNEFQLTDYLDMNTDKLPLGIKQRLALSCSLLHQPAILFLDEPTSGVDPLARREFWQRINLLAAQGVTILITTHYMDEAEYCDRLVLMSLGEILAQGTPAQIRAMAVTEKITHPTMEDAFIHLIESHESDIRRAF